jgi:hypothetical protein
MSVASYYVSDSGSDVAGNGTSWSNAYATIQFAADDIWATHGTSQRNIVYCQGDFTISTPLDFSTNKSPVPSLGTRLLLVSAGRDAVNDGQRCILRGDDNIVYDPVSDYIFYIGFEFTWCNLNNNSGQRAFRVDRNNEWIDCKFSDTGTATQSGIYQGVWYNGFRDCIFDNMYYGTGHSIGGFFDGCYFKSKPGRGGGFSIYRTGRVSNCVIWTDGNANAVYCQAGGDVTNNVMIQNNSGGGPIGKGIRVITEARVISNNYFHNFDIGISIESGTADLRNNFTYNCTNPVSVTTADDLIARGPDVIQNTVAEQPLFVDAANLDLRLNQSWRGNTNEPWGLGYPGPVTLFNQVQPVAARVRG